MPRIKCADLRHLLTPLEGRPGAGILIVTWAHQRLTDRIEANIGAVESVRTLSQALRAKGHKANRTLVGQLLHYLGYSLQAKRKTREGTAHPDRDAQFQYINAQVNAAFAAGDPAISVDTKKKELVGNFRNAGRTWRPRAHPNRSGC